MLHCFLATGVRHRFNWTIINGDTETGVTTFFFCGKTVDTGNILFQERTPVGPDETAGELAERLSVIGAGAVVKTLELIRDGKAEPLGHRTMRGRPKHPS